MQVKEEDLGCWTSREGRAGKSIVMAWKQDILLVIITVSQDQGLQCLASLGVPCWRAGQVHHRCLWWRGEGEDHLTRCQSSSLCSGESKHCSLGTQSTLLGAAALPIFSTLHRFPARQAFILEIRAATFLLFRKKQPFSSIIAVLIIHVTNSRAVKGCQSPASDWSLTLGKPT